MLFLDQAPCIFCNTYKANMYSYYHRNVWKNIVKKFPNFSEGRQILEHPNCPPNLFFSFLFLFISLNMKPLSEVAPGLLVIQIQIQAVWKVKSDKNKHWNCNLFRREGLFTLFSLAHWGFNLLSLKITLKATRVSLCISSQGQKEPCWP